jgi:hypothetical protein
MLKKYPEYLQFDLQSKMPEIYRHAGALGNMIIAAPNPVMLPALRLTPRTIGPPSAVAAPTISPTKLPARTPPAANGKDVEDE